MDDKTILRTNELENAIDYLGKAAYYFNNREDSYWFKWLMISLHGALYGFGVCAIKGTSPSLRVLDKPSTKKIKELIPLLSERSLGMEDPIPKDHLAVLADEHLLSVINILAENNLNKIWDILDKCENPDYMIQYTDSKVLKRTDLQSEAIQKMVDYRNDFAHFKPKGLSILIESEEWIAKEVVDVIKFLALESGNVNYFDEGNLDKVKLLFEKF
ncbi:hypothetical protein [Bacillus sp. OTU530]|uniref:hypothetical protein n=1 Tax=Bacillus sp. OTU530 TaxID=3043862 RepID=UPI00313E4746